MEDAAEDAATVGSLLAAKARQRFQIRVVDADTERRCAARQLEVDPHLSRLGAATAHLGRVGVDERSGAGELSVGAPNPPAKILDRPSSILDRRNVMSHLVLRHRSHRLLRLCHRQKCNTCNSFRNRIGASTRVPRPFSTPRRGALRKKRSLQPRNDVDIDTARQLASVVGPTLQGLRTIGERLDDDDHPTAVRIQSPAPSVSFGGALRIFRLEAVHDGRRLVTAQEQKPIVALTRAHGFLATYVDGVDSLLRPRYR